MGRQSSISLFRVTTDLPPFELGFPGPLRDRLVAAVLDGTKTTTTGLLQDFERNGEPVTTAGTRSALIDSAGAPVAVVEVTEVRIVRLADVDLGHARDEGEGNDSVASWRVAHERYWHGPAYLGWLGDPAFRVNDDTLAVLERFELR
jgi:uncharacterized protein YhfF